MDHPDRPVWLLDVDGVLNAQRPGWGAPPHQAEVEAAHGRSWRIRWAPALVDAIRHLHESGTVEIRWSTSWIPYAHRIEEALGLPVLEPAFLADEQMVMTSTIRSKAIAACHVLEREKRPLIWTDDEATYSWVGPASDDRTRALVIRPDPRRGLQPDDIYKITAFISRHTPGLP